MNCGICECTTKTASSHETDTEHTFPTTIVPLMGDEIITLSDKSEQIGDSGACIIPKSIGLIVTSS